MSDLLADWWNFEITVQPFAGSGGLGPVYGEPFTFMGAVDDTTKLVRSPGGEEVVSSTRVFGPLSVPHIASGSRVTLPAPFSGSGVERTSRVISVSRKTSGLDTPDHVEVVLE